MIFSIYSPLLVAPIYWFAELQTAREVGDGAGREVTGKRAPQEGEREDSRVEGGFLGRDCAGREGFYIEAGGDRVRFRGEGGGGLGESDRVMVGHNEQGNRVRVRVPRCHRTRRYMTPSTVADRFMRGQSFLGMKRSSVLLRLSLR